jgi:serine/threonine protein kinase
MALKQLTCPYVIMLYDYERTPDSVYIFLEYCPHGALDTIIDKSGPLSGAKLYGMCKAILTGLAYIHSNRCAHSDLKPANILIDRYGRPKLADFGFSRVFTQNTLTDEHAGSMGFAAPEIFQPRSFDPFKADIWAAAMTIIYIATANLPWKQHVAPLIVKEIESGVMVPPRDFDPKLMPLIRSMTSKNPAQRPTADKCLTIEPIASADVKNGFLLPDKRPIPRPVIKDPRLSHASPLAIAGRSASVKRMMKPRAANHTFDSDPG